MVLCNRGFKHEVLLLDKIYFVFSDISVYLVLILTTFILCVVQVSVQEDATSLHCDTMFK